MASSPEGEAGPDDTAGEPTLHRLHPRVRTVWRFALLGRTAFFTAAAAVGERWVDLPAAAGVLPAVVAAVGLALAAFWPSARYRAWGFRVRENDLYVRHGVVWRVVSVVPHRRIQHVDTRNGPLERALGLAQVVVYTAGARGADVTVPGLGRERAESLRDRLAALGGLDDGV